MFAQKKKYWCSTKLNMSFVAIIIGINKAIMSYYLRFLQETQNALLTSTNYDCTTDCPETSNDITPRLYFASGGLLSAMQDTQVSKEILKLSFRPRHLFVAMQ